MSSVYRSSDPRRITAPKLTARSLEARIVYLHLIHGEVAGQIPGIIRAGVLAVAEDTALDPAVVRRALTELADHVLAEVDEAARLIRLPGVLEDAERLHSNPSAVIGWARVLADLPESPVRARHAAAIMRVAPAAQQGLFAALAEGAAPVAPSSPPRHPPVDGGVYAPSTQDTDTNPDPEQDPEQEQCAAAPLALSPPPAAKVARSARGRKPVEPSPLAEAVFATWTDLRFELGILTNGDRRPAIAATHVAHVARANLSLELWQLVLRRAAESLRREAEDQGRAVGEVKGATYFTLESLGRPANCQRYLDQPSLDRRRGPPSRASPSRAPKIAAPPADVVEGVRVYRGGEPSE